MRLNFVLLLAFALIFSCSGTKKTFEQAQKYEKAGLYVQAVEYDLLALKKKPDYTEALLHLKRVAPKAYEELLARAKNFASAEEWDQAVDQYQQLRQMLGEVQRHGVIFKTVDVKEQLATAKQKAAANHFANAERLYAQNRWDAAAVAYLKASGYVENYNKSIDKAILAFVNAGDAKRAEKQYIAAIDTYHEILDIAPNSTLAKTKIAETHYDYGRVLFTREQYRGALEHFELAGEYVPGFKDLESWRQRAYENAVMFVAILPFVNQSKHPVDGYFIAAEIYNRVVSPDLRFADFMPHAETMAMVSKLRNTRPMMVSETQAVSIAQQEELNSIIWGKIRDVSIKDRPEKVKEYEHLKTTTRKDSSGKEVEETETIYFREHVRSRYIRITLEYAIIDTETGRHLDNERLTEDIEDKAIWIAYQGSIYDLPEDKRAFLDAPRDPEPQHVLIDQLLLSQIDKISRDLIRFYQ
jgi:tetratricopeptide (TPR) repeat protein